MPVFVEDPVQFSKERLKTELIAHNVDLPPAESKKHVYLELYLTHVKRNGPDFSSDEEEEDLQNGSAEKDGDEESDMVDLSSMTDDQLKAKLLQYGIKAGPIVATTRALYERKLHRLMDSSTQSSQHRVNGIIDAGQYSDSEEEAEREEEEDKKSESEQPKVTSKIETETNKTNRGKIQQRSLDSSQTASFGQSGSPYKSFSITQMIENRFSPQSKHAEIERRSIQTPECTVSSRALRDGMRWDKDTMTGRSLCVAPPSPHQKQTITEPVTDVLTEMLLEAAKTPTGICATRRKPIKGAAGRPVQFKYPEIPLSPTTLERQEIQQRLMPLWVQIVVFLLVACLLYLIYSSMEEPLLSPFTALLEGLQEEPAHISSMQNTELQS